MRKILTVFCVLALVPIVQAQEPIPDSNWTEFAVTIFDQVDGDFAPRLTGAVVNFIDGKGIGAFLGRDDAIGPLVLWRVWKMSFGALDVSIFTVASTDVSGADTAGVFSNGTFGLEPRVYWEQFGNASIGLGVLSTTFIEGEKAEWTPYMKLVFRP